MLQKLPFSLMNALDAQQFNNYWIQCSISTFFAGIIKKQYDQFDPKYLSVSSNDLHGLFEIDAVPLSVAMFQTSCLTIADYDRDRRRYHLNFPNIEAEKGFHFLGLAFKREPKKFDVDYAMKELSSSIAEK
jgi:hypothetical protein